MNVFSLKHSPGSGAAAAPDEQIVWFGQPAHAEACPAASLLGPGQAAMLIQN